MPEAQELVASASFQINVDISNLLSFLSESKSLINEINQVKHAISKLRSLQSFGLRPKSNRLKLILNSLSKLKDRLESGSFIGSEGGLGIDLSRMKYKLFICVAGMVRIPTFLFTFLSFLLVLSSLSFYDNFNKALFPFAQPPPLEYHPQIQVTCAPNV